MKDKVVVQLGRAGDIILMLPAFKAMAERDGRNPVVMVSTEYYSVLEGVSYVTPWPVPMHWAHDVQKAREGAELHGFDPIVPAWWNDRLAEDMLIKSDTPSKVRMNGDVWQKLQINGNDFFVNSTKYPSFMASMWHQCGFDWKDIHAKPVVFDKRNEQRERALVDTFIHRTKPTVLYNFGSISSPFAHQAEMMAVMRELNHRIHFVDLSWIKAERLYDLLGLMDYASGIISVDTATLHLCAGTQTPHIAICNDGWSGSMPKGNCALSFTYSQSMGKRDAFRKTLIGWANKAVATTKKIDPNDPPSVTEQTPWNCQILDCGDPLSDYLNPGLVAVDGVDYLFARQCFTPPGWKFAQNVITVFSMDEQKKLTRIKTLKLIQHFEGEHFEDPRIFLWEGFLWLSCCNFVWNQNNKSTYTHQVLFKLDKQFNCLERIDPMFWGNGGDLTKNTRSEKNWTWLPHNGELIFCYATSPLVIGGLDAKIRSTDKKETGWKWGEIRGGTPPVLIGDEYWCFFHSSEPAPEHASRRYHMGAIVFDQNFRITRITTKPLLSGSRHDRTRRGLPLVVFPCGSKYQDGLWTVSFGVNDLDCAIIEIPHKELLPLMKNL